MRPLLPREKGILWVLAVLVVAVGFYLWVWKPQSAQIGVLSQQLKSKQVELARLEAQAAQLDQLKKRLEELNREVADTEAKLPTSREIPALLVQLEGLASQVGANLTLIRPGPQQGAQTGGQQPRPGTPPSPAPSLGLQQFNLELNAEGTFDNVQSFLRGIENFPRFIAMSDLKITPLPARAGEGAGRPKLAIGVTATTYFAPESGARR